MTSAPPITTATIELVKGGGGGGGGGASAHFSGGGGRSFFGAGGHHGFAAGGGKGTVRRALAVRRAGAVTLDTDGALPILDGRMSMPAAASTALARAWDIRSVTDAPLPWTTTTAIETGITTITSTSIITASSTTTCSCMAVTTATTATTTVIGFAARPSSPVVVIGGAGTKRTRANTELA